MEKDGAVTVQEALDRLLQAAPPRPGIERIPTQQARNRYMAEPVQAQLSMPSYSASAIDGIAVRSEATQAASPHTPMKLREGEDFAWINTGDPIPAWADAVIMVEHVNVEGEGCVAITRPASSFQHVRQTGEDVAAGEVLLSAGQKIRPVDQAVLLAGGVWEVPVLTRPLVTIIATGRELVPPGLEPQRGEIVEFNSTLLGETLREWGAITRYGGIVPDDPALIRQTLEHALEQSDLVIVNAGSSKGAKDFVPSVLKEMGTLLVHGVSARPGKPAALAVVAGKPVLGLPGYPVSAYLGLEWFAKPWIRKWRGERTSHEEEVPARLSQPVHTRMGAEDHLRVRLLAGPDGNWDAIPLTKGAGVTFSLSQADGWIKVPADSSQWTAGKNVSVRLTRPLSLLRDRILVAGGDAPALDILLSAWSKQSGRAVARYVTGMQDALDRWRKGTCAAVVVETDGTDTLPECEERDTDLSHALPLGDVTWGWIVQKGNPDAIVGIQDWHRSDLHWILPPSGHSGRIFLEKAAVYAGVSIPLHRKEEPSYLKAAAAVYGEGAAAAWGIAFAEYADTVDFLPIARRRLSLLVTPSLLKETEGEILLQLLQDQPLRKVLQRSGLDKPTIIRG
ncbi:molybdenum cofactor synthesis domain-containing protein [Desmospora activa]|uniref:Molybdopterin molybdenumtransferase n=1 Tax=Desmospora activa DSM 45169 TaxID=1121389 RepID=A0A2T4Z0I5_9BACL|nr:molybdenum cofactor synthesis domain-containing protein [Desmospora activa]PTM53257.1 molybdopterin molybdochelatase [Desmospora activa DSM 45169]